jgi:hypothetical protein
MSILSEAFQHCLNVREGALGFRDEVLLSGSPVDAMVEAITASEIFVAGGKAESGGFRCQIAVDDLSEPPAKFSPIVVRGVALKVLDVDDINGIVWHVTAGDPASEK